VPGVPIERELAGGETHTYHITLAAGQYLRVVVDQRGIDVIVKIFGPDGQPLAEMDMLNSRGLEIDPQGPEPVSVVADASGTYRVEVHALEKGATPGRYELRIEELREAVPDDATRMAAERALAEGSQRLWQGMGIAEAWPSALEKLEEALRLWRLVEDRRGQAYTLLLISNVYWQLDDLLKMLECDSQALPLFQAMGDRYGEAVTLDNIGYVYSWLGEAQKALEHFGQALPLWRAVGNRRAEANTLLNAGWVYLELGDHQETLRYYHQALLLYQAVGYRRAEGRMLSHIGHAYRDMGELQKALQYYSQALPLRRTVGDRRGEADTLEGFGDVYRALGEYEKALGYYNQALSLRRAVGDRQGEAVILSSIGGIYSSLGEHQKALNILRQAIPVHRASGDRLTEAATLSRIARVERERGDLTEARAQAEAALDIIESVRTRVPSQQLRVAYLASKRDYYEFYIDLLMRLDQHDPSQGHDTAALQASERARARSLLETLIEARADIRQGVDPPLLERERTVQQQLNAEAERLTRLLSGQHTEDQAAAARKEIDELLAQFQEVQAQIRARSPRYAALTQPQPLSLKEIQQQVLDEDTMLLEYALGEERGFLWAVTPTSIASFELPNRAEIETAARRVYELMSTSNLGADKEEAEAMAALSQMLLEPVADQLGNKRLLIVSDGALQYVPFAALPKPEVKDQARMGGWADG
jgi:tetratricopeptide (TPR) repeat protein